MKRSVSVRLLFSALIILMVPIPSVHGKEVYLNNAEPDFGMPLIVEHVRIEGNDDLLEKAEYYQWPGDGTADDPIVISGFKFQNFERSFCPIINDTDLHLRIDRCHFSNLKKEMGYYSDHGEGGVLIRRSSNISVENCSADSIQVFARSEDSANIRILNNSATHDHSSIIINRCESTLIRDNWVHRVGILVSDSIRTTLINNTLIRWGAKLSVSGSENTVIEDNNMVYSEVRFIIDDSRNTYISGNRFYGRGLEIQGDEETYETLYIGGNNTVNDRPIISIRDTGDIDRIGDFGQLFLINVTDSLIKQNENIDMPDESAVNLVLCRNVTLSLDNSSMGQSSILITLSSGCTVKEGHFRGSGYGIGINRSEGVEIRDFVFLETHYPVELEESKSCIVDNITIISPRNGVNIRDSSYIIIRNSSINGDPGSGESGITISGSSLHNSIIDNTLMDVLFCIPSLYDIYSSVYYQMDLPHVREIIRTLVIEGTTLNGRMILKLNDVDMRGRDIPDNTGSLVLLNVSNLDIADRTFSGEGFITYMIDCFNVEVNRCGINSTGYHGVLIIRSRSIRLFQSSINHEGIIVVGSYGVQIERCDFSTRSVSIYLIGSEIVDLNDLQIQGTNHAMIVYECRQVSISRSRIFNSSYGIDMRSTSNFSAYDISVAVENTALNMDSSQNTTILRSKFKSGNSPLTISGSAGDMIAYCTFEGGSYGGVEIDNWRDSILSETRIDCQSSTWISVTNSGNCRFSHLILRSNMVKQYHSGFRFSNVTKFIVDNNTISGVDWSGINAYEMFDTILQENRMIDVSQGITIYSGSGNTIRWNHFINNTYGSVRLHYHYVRPSVDIHDNTIYGNYFMDNWTVEEYLDQWKHPARDNGFNNTWYSEEYGGNYWTWVKGPDMDRDGFVDYPFVINGTAGSIDRYPIAHPDLDVKNNRGFPFVPEIMIIIAILIFILLILAGVHKIGFHVKKDPDLNGD
ncbi:MAG: NosD domain-containing protein [Thermoplasmatota archaeon]